MRKRRAPRTEWPVIMPGSDVRAILAETKTQFRRIILPQPPEMPAPNCHPNHEQRHPAPYLDSYCSRKVTPENPRGMSEEWLWWQVDDRACPPHFKCPYGAPGDVLWVRETWRPAGLDTPLSECAGPEDIDFGASASELDRALHRWRPSSQMPRWASRLLLKVESVRACRLMDITEEEAKLEGVSSFSISGEPPTYRAGFAYRWNHQGNALWNENPPVWAVTFRRIEQKDAEAAA